MTIHDHYTEVLELTEKLLTFIFDSVNILCQRELMLISQQYSFDPVIYKDSSGRIPRIEYREAVQLLKSVGVQQNPAKGLSTQAEIQLGNIIKKKFGVDCFMLIEYPLASRPFYTMRCDDDTTYSNSYDVFLRGEEIASGSQRINDLDVLIKSAGARGVNLNNVKPYLDSFKYGSWPHAGIGLGLERLCMQFLGLSNIRHTSLFPTDSKRLY